MSPFCYAGYIHFKKHSIGVEESEYYVIANIDLGNYFVQLFRVVPCGGFVSISPPPHVIPLFSIVNGLINCVYGEGSAHSNAISCSVYGDGIYYSRFLRVTITLLTSSCVIAFLFTHVPRAVLGSNSFP